MEGGKSWESKAQEAVFILRVLFPLSPSPWLDEEEDAEASTGARQLKAQVTHSQAVGVPSARICGVALAGWLLWDLGAATGKVSGAILRRWRAMPEQFSLPHN